MTYEWELEYFRIVVKSQRNEKSTEVIYTSTDTREVFLLDFLDELVV